MELINVMIHNNKSAEINHAVNIFDFEIFVVNVVVIALYL